MESQTLMFGNTCIPYTIFSDHNRKTAKIIVYPDKRVVVAVSPGTSLEECHDMVVVKASWIFNQIQHYSFLQAISKEREFRSGETHLYLGRHYRLKIIVTESKKSTITLKRGFFEVDISQNDLPHQREKIKKLLQNWYIHHGKIRIQALISTLSVHLSITPPSFQIRRMEKRWGSYTPQGRVLINLNILMAPPSLIEYVVLHELCHVIYYDHSSEFWKLIRRIMPDYEIRKEKLLKEGWRYHI